MLLFRQIVVLVRKDLLFLYNPKRFRTMLWRSLVIPIVFTVYMSFILKIYWPKESYGVGTPNPVRSLPEAMQLATGGRNTLALVNTVSSGGDIDRVIQMLAQSVQVSGKTAKILTNYEDLVQTCQSTLQGTTKCYGAVVFNSSPKEGSGGIWNYTLRADAALGSNINVGKTTNDAQVYQLPLQRAVDMAIATVNSTEEAMELPSLMNTLTLHSIYIKNPEGMDMPNSRRWEPQLARLVAHHLAFTIAYGPSWIIMGIIAKAGIFPYTSGGIVVVFFILGGLALTSCSIFGASFFRKAQLSGISTVVVILGLGIAAQIKAKEMDSATVATLSLLFTPMTFVFGFIFISRFEHASEAANLTHAAPGWFCTLPGIVLWVLLIVQIIVYPILGGFVERWLYGTASRRSRRKVLSADSENSDPVLLSSFMKVYQKNLFLRFVGSLFGRKLNKVVAIDDVSLAAFKGQILVLVGPNGSGKTTILNAIAGLSSITGGSITIDGSGGIGLCPQQNVLWNGLTVEQHATIFSTLKGSSVSNVEAEVENLIQLCDLQDKRKSPARTLSGGQKRKLQLIMMLAGGSRVCCVDEVSGGLDPLSRRKVWNIILAERGTRTFILTTHFLDEAEYLADHMAIISRGHLQAKGSTSELKARLGNGYRFSIPPGAKERLEMGLETFSSKLQAQQTFATGDPAVALEKIKVYRMEGIKNYQIAGPTIEEVFMKLTMNDEKLELDDLPRNYNLRPSQSPIYPGGKISPIMSMDEKRHNVVLLTGRPTSAFRQASILFQKRTKILRWQWVLFLAVITIPVIAAGLISIILKDFQNPGCSFMDQVDVSKIEGLSTTLTPQLVVGPPDALTPQRVQLLMPFLTEVSWNTNETSLLHAVYTVNTLDQFNSFTESNYSTIVPGGLFLGSNTSTPTFDYRSDLGVLGLYSAIFLQNAMDVMLSNESIVTQYAVFDFPWPANTGDSLQFLYYFGLIMAAYPAFFALYPTIERLRGVRALQYSNGVRSLPLWLAYLVFDGIIVIFVSVLCTIIFVTYIPNAWYYPAELFVCLCLYGIASILLAYTISLLARSQLAAFAFSAGGQAFMLLMYMTAYMNINVHSPPEKIVSNILIVTYTMGLITPIGQLIRAIIICLNLFSAVCTGFPPAKSPNPGSINLYGGPIVYLIGQSLCLFGILIWFDHGFSLNIHRRSKPQASPEDTTTNEPEVSEEIYRVSNSNDDGIRVLHASKSFGTGIYGKVTAVEDLTFGVRPGEVFALVGPNGAGKSMTISMLRGEIKPNRGPGEIYIQNIPVATDRDAARSHLSVCPQFDAMDQMTVAQHLRFYAAVRGVNDIERNVQALMKAVGLAPYAGRMGSKLSGGNKRKLSLAIALIGNPEVLLLDEPSSGMDPLAKRNMWKTLSHFVPHRSILLTTHSMEEADALADRVGVLAKHMLDIGTTQHLRQKHGSGFHIHLVLKSAPQSTDYEVEGVKDWIEERLPGSVLEREPYHGQMRFNIPSSNPQLNWSDRKVGESSQSKTEDEISVGSLFILLEENKEKLGLAFHSVAPSTFDEIFLKVVQKHGIGEQDLQINKPSWHTVVKKFLFWGLIT